MCVRDSPYAATVVQDIFNWKIQGLTNNGIAIRLAESGILAPLEYKRHKGEPLFSGFKMKARCEWTAQAVARCLLYTSVRRPDRCHSGSRLRF